MCKSLEHDVKDLQVTKHSFHRGRLLDCLFGALIWNPNTIVRSDPEKSGSHIVLLLVFSVMVCAANTFSSHFSRKVKQTMVSVRRLSTLFPLP